MWNSSGVVVLGITRCTRVSSGIGFLLIGQVILMFQREIPSVFWPLGIRPFSLTFSSSFVPSWLVGRVLVTLVFIVWVTETF